MRHLALTILQLWQELRKHILRLLRRQETARAAAAGVAKTTARFARGVAKKPPTQAHKSAVGLVNKGVKAYNRKSYHEAEHLFKAALERDQAYARAHLYLGNTWYKMGEKPKAIKAWNHAMEAEPTSKAAEAAMEKLLKVQQHHAQQLHQTIERLENNR